MQIRSSQFIAMHIRIILFLIFFLNLFVSNAQDFDITPFKIYNSKGKEVNYTQLVEEVSKTEVFLFGEHHNDALIHWIQYRLVKDLISMNTIVLGAEFFEVDDQVALQEYMMGLLPEKNLDDEIHLWPNYKTDYAPIVQLAKDSGIAFVATNVPRRYASLVSKKGLDTLEALSAAAKSFLPDLPIPFSMDTPGYSEMLEMMGGHMPGMNINYFVEAQALKDATMATSIIKNRTDGVPFVHINGDFHSANYGGIYWYLKEYDPKLKIKTLKVFSEDGSLDFNSEKHTGGDFILIVTSDFTKTH
jgi:uncharacterized iron-regulated protein